MTSSIVYVVYARDLLDDEEWIVKTYKDHADADALAVALKETAEYFGNEVKYFVNAEWDMYARV